MRSLTVSAALVAAASFLVTAAEGAAAEPGGQVLALSCFSCHGPDGKSPASIPAIGGKSEDFIVKAMTAFRTGERPSTVMGRLAKGYTDAEIAALAQYISSLK